MKGQIIEENGEYIVEFSREGKPEGLRQYLFDPSVRKVETMWLNHEMDFEIRESPGGVQYAYITPANPKSTIIPTKLYKRTPSEKIQNITDSLNRLLQAKNKNYGSSALSPLGIFNKNEATEGIKVRLDDKLMRVKNSDILRKNDIADIMGYLVLLCVSEEWLNFDELID